MVTERVFRIAIPKSQNDIIDLISLIRLMGERNIYLVVQSNDSKNTGTLESLEEKSHPQDDVTETPICKCGGLVLNGRCCVCKLPFASLAGINAG
jgi:hypothetical protein